VPVVIPPTATDTPTPVCVRTRTGRPTDTATATATSTPTAMPTSTDTPTVTPLTLPLILAEAEDDMPSSPIYEFFLIMGLLALAVLLAGERVRASLLRQGQSQYALALQQLALQRASLGRTIAVPAEGIVATANQIVFDVLGEPAGIDQLFDVSAEVPLAMTFAHQQRRFFTFTPQPDKARPLYPRGHWFMVDALTAHPFVAEELAAAYDTALSIKKRGEPSLLPRSQQWGLVVWERPQKPKRWSLPRSRWWLRRAREVGG